VRILFTTFEGGGHVPPAIVVARELQRRGHVLRFVSDEANRPLALSAGLEFESWRRAPNRLAAGRRDDPLDDWRSRWPPRVVRAICDAVICGPAAGYAVDTLDQLARFRPDLVVSNELLFGVMIAAEAAATPLALLAPNVWCFPTRDDLPPFGPGFAPARHEFQRRRDQATRQMIARMYDAGLPDLNRARRLLGLEPLGSTLAQLRTARRVVLGTSRGFDFGIDPPPPPFVYVGPLFERGDESPHRGAAAPGRDLALLRPDLPNVLVACSTAYQDQGPLVARCIEALARLPVHGIVTLGPALEARQLPSATNVTVVPFASHDVLAARCAAVICQGGHGTLLRALMHGTPVLCIPGGRDQFDNAQRVVQRGAGLRLWRRCSARSIGRAVGALLADSRWRRGAATLGAAIRADFDHGRSAADALETAAAPRCVSGLEQFECPR
jgi:UDP:flavonoid glycosyltransferase YjiC (YdhE family)